MERPDKPSHFLLSAASDASSPPRANQSPCAACRVLRRKCLPKCVLAPYFTPDNPLKFTIAHKVFGACNISKLLQEIPEHLRADAVNSMVYEANARIRDPVYGCTGIISNLHNQISELQEELAKERAEKLILNKQSQNSCPGSSFSIAMPENPDINPQQQLAWDYANTTFSVDNGNISRALGNHFGI